MPPEESSESISAPVSALGGATVGDTVTFTVDSIDGDMASLSPAESNKGQTTENQGSAVSQAAKLFDGGDE